MARRTGLPVGVAEGSRVGAFTVIEAIGAGPAAYAFYAEDASANGAVLRFLRPEFAREKDWVAHFTTAAKALSKVAQQTKQKRVLPVLGIGFHGEAPYVVEEYAGERSLAYVLYNEGVQFAEAVRLMSQVADVLNTLHAASPPLFAVAVRPTDVFLEKRGSTTQVTVAHCGILKSPLLPVPAMRRCFTVAAPECMAPEVLEGGPASVAGDIYSLGMLFLRMIRGSYGMARFIAGAREGRSPAEVFAEDETTAADAVMQRCLAPDPAQRHASMDELLDALDALDTKRFARTRRPQDLMISPPPKPVPASAPELEGEEVADGAFEDEEDDEGRTAKAPPVAEGEDEFDYSSFFESLGRQAAEESASESDEKRKAREWEEQQRAERERKRQARRRGAILTLDEAAWDAALRDAGIIEEAAVAEPEPEAVAEAVAVAEPEPEVVAETVAVAEPEVVAEAVAVAEPEVVAEEVAVAEPEVVAEEVAVAEPEPPEEPVPLRAPLVVLMASDLASAAPSDGRGPGSNGETAPLLDREVAQLYRGAPGPITFRAHVDWVREEQLAPAAAMVPSGMGSGGARLVPSPLAREVALLYRGVPGRITFRAHVDWVREEQLAPAAAMVPSGMGSGGAQLVPSPLAREVALLYRGVPGRITFRAHVEWVREEQLAPAAAMVPSGVDSGSAQIAPSPLAREVALLYPAVDAHLVFRAYAEVLADAALSPADGVGAPERPVGAVDVDRDIIELAEALALSDARPPALEREIVTLYRAAAGPLVFRTRLEVLMEEELSGRAEDAAPAADGPALSAEVALLFTAPAGVMVFRRMVSVTDEPWLALPAAMPSASRIVALSAAPFRVPIAELAAAAGVLNPAAVRPLAVSADIARLYAGAPGAITYRPHLRPVIDADLAPVGRQTGRRPTLAPLSDALSDVPWPELSASAARAGSASLRAGLVEPEMAGLYPAVPVRITYRSMMQAVVLEPDLAGPELRRRRRLTRIDLAPRLATMPWADLAQALQRTAPDSAIGTPLVASEVAGLFPALLPYLPPREHSLTEESVAAVAPLPRWEHQLAARAARLRVPPGEVPDLADLASALDSGVRSPLTSSEVARLFPAPTLPAAVPKPRRRRPGAFAAAPGAHVEAGEAPATPTAVTPPPAPAKPTRPAAPEPPPVVAPEPKAMEAAPAPTPSAPPKPTLAQLMLDELARRNHAYYVANRARSSRDGKRTNILGLEVAQDWAPEADLNEAVTVDVSAGGGDDIKVQFGEEEPYAFDLAAEQDEGEMIQVELADATAALTSVAGLVRQTHQAQAYAAAGGELIDVDLDSDFTLTVADMVRMSHEATLAQAQAAQALEGLIGLSDEDEEDTSFDFGQLVRSQFADVEEAETDASGLEASADGRGITVADLLSSEDGIQVGEAELSDGIQVSSDATFTLADMLAEKRAEETARKREQLESLDFSQLDLDATAAIDALTDGLGLDTGAESGDSAVAAFEQWKELPAVGSAARRPSRRERTLRGMIFELMAELAIRQGDEELDTKAHEALTTLINAATNFVKLLPRKGG